MRDFKDRVAVVTGGAGGLGRAVGLRLAGAGARVALWDVDQEGLARAAAGFRAAGLEAGTYRLDASDPAAVREAAERVRSDLGEVDILDNNAGIVAAGEFVQADEAAMARTVDVNLKSYIWCARAFLPGMMERNRGHVIWIASAAGLLGVPGMAVYSATKHAVVGLAESIRLELREAGATGVGTTIACPSFISTGMFEGVRPPLLTPWLTPDEVADKILAAVRSGRRYVREPLMVKLVPLIKALPGWASDAAGDLTGMHRAMRTHTGRKR